jgi:hypothetical protein
MKKRILLVLMTIVLLFPVVMVGCQELGGVAQETYDEMVAELNEIKAKYTDALTKYDELNAEKNAIEAQFQDCQSKNTDLENQLACFHGVNQLKGDTITETAEKIVKYYHDTHIYSSYDLFVCSDMASEVWNMLKAQDIASIIVVGNKDVAISDILQSNHAWVLAEVIPGKYLALETTGGYSVTASKNPLYYQGWSFDRPADLKSYGTLVQEYNVRVGIRNNINNEANAVADLHNNSSSQTQADKYKAVYDKLVELRTEQETILNNIMAQIKVLATVLL